MTKQDKGEKYYFLKQRCLMQDTRTRVVENQPKWLINGKIVYIAQFDA